MRRICRTDNNQRQIVEALRSMGYSVAHLHQLGRGLPDLLVGVNGYNFLLEIKQEKHKKLTADEQFWHTNWQGQVAIASSVQEAVNICGLKLSDHSYLQLQQSKEAIT